MIGRQLMNDWKNTNSGTQSNGNEATAAIRVIREGKCDMIAK